MKNFYKLLTAMTAPLCGCPPEITGTAEPEYAPPQAKPGYFIGADGQERLDPEAEEGKTGNFWFISPNESDADGDGTKENPWFSINKAQAAAAAGDTVYIRGGTYYIGNDIGGSFTESYMTAFLMEKSGEEKSDGGVNRINYFGYPGERPVFDMSGFDRNTGATSSGAASGRFAAFMIKGSYLHFKNFEAIGLRARFLS